MLAHLTINNYTIVDHLDLEFEPGRTVVTGETGAAAKNRRKLRNQKIK